MVKTKKISICIGSKNPAKVNAAKISFEKFFDHVEIKSFDIPSNVSHQPKSFEEIVEGAENRAKGAFAESKCDYGVGIEAGIFRFPGKTGYMDICITAIYDGNKFFHGGSPVFEYPKFVVDKIFNDGKEVGHILDEHLNRKNVKHGEGAIGWLSGGKMERTEYVQISVFMALVSLVNREMY